MMADMEARIEMNYLLDFYGPLLSGHRRELMGLYCEEDLSYSEIAEQLNITRQGVSDAIGKARRQLCEYEEKLGLVARYLALTKQAGDCLDALRRIHPDPSDREDMDRAMRALENIIQIER